MKYTLALIATFAALSTAQVTITPNGDFICTGNINGAYCAGDSLKTNIIIRCNNGTGQPGNCDDNTAGDFPFGDIGGAHCYQTDLTSGNAACEKNCVVYKATPVTLPLSVCTPTATQTSQVSATSYPLSSTPASNNSVTITSTGTSSYVNGQTTIWTTFTTTYCPPITTTYSYPASRISFSTSVPAPNTTYIYSSASGSPTVISNGTYTSTVGQSGGSPPQTTGTAVPVGPTGTSTAAPSTYTGAAAMTNSAGAGLAVIGLFIAYFL